MRNRIKALLRERGWSNVDLAEKINAHPTTVSRLVNERILLGESWLLKLSEAFAVPPEEILAAPLGVRNVTVRGTLEGGAWSQSWHFPESAVYHVPIPDDSLLQGMTLTAAETKGPSANRRYPIGTVVVFNDFVEASEPLREGSRYVIERRRGDGHVEATVKLLWRDPDRTLWLVNESDDPRYQDAVRMNGQVDARGAFAEGTITTRILGRVLYSVHREP